MNKQNRETIDPAHLGREYTETDQPVEVDRD